MKATETQKEYMRIYYAEHKEQAHNKAIARYAANKERILSRNRAYAKAHPEVARANAANMRKLYPDRSAARLKVRTEIRAGRFPPANTMVCDICQEALAHHWHHHLGYEQEHALDVIAVCRECHIKEHHNGK